MAPVSTVQPTAAAGDYCPTLSGEPGQAHRIKCFKNKDISRVYTGLLLDVCSMRQRKNNTRMRSYKLERLKHGLLDPLNPPHSCQTHALIHVPPTPQCETQWTAFSALLDERLVQKHCCKLICPVTSKQTSEPTQSCCQVTSLRASSYTDYWAGTQKSMQMSTQTSKHAPGLNLQWAIFFP